jgi:hypothetical protein
MVCDHDLARPKPRAAPAAGGAQDGFLGLSAGAHSARHVPGAGGRSSETDPWWLRLTQVAIAGYGSLPEAAASPQPQRRAAFLIASLAALAMVACVGAAVVNYDQVLGCTRGRAAALSREQNGTAAGSAALRAAAWRLGDHRARSSWRNSGLAIFCLLATGGWRLQFKPCQHAFPARH